VPGTATALRRPTVAAWAATLLVPLAAVAPTAQAASRPAVAWSDTSVTVGGRVAATVTVRSVPAGATVTLQRRFPDRWRVADATATRTDAGLELRVPTDQFGQFTYRVAASRKGDVVSTSDTRQVTVRTGYHPRGRASQHRFLYDQRTRWDSCRAVRWKFNDSLAPRHGLRQVQAAVRRIHAATGLEFDYRGKTDHRSNPYGDHIAGAAVVVGWRSARTFQRYVGSPQVVGLAGQRFLTGFRDSDGRVSKTQQAGVILNAGHHLRGGFGTGTTWGEVIVHELGHVVGLDHSGSRKQVMYYATTAYDASLGKGDLAGMRALGDTRGCLARTSSRATAGSGLTP
jgi:hypothetical protein